MSYRYFAARLSLGLALLTLPAFSQAANPGPVVAWSIPPGILQKASAEYHSKVGSDYEGACFTAAIPAAFWTRTA